MWDTGINCFYRSVQPVPVVPPNPIYFVLSHPWESLYNVDMALTSPFHGMCESTWV